MLLGYFCHHGSIPFNSLAHPYYIRTRSSNGAKELNCRKTMIDTQNFKKTSYTVVRNAIIAGML